ncbi:Kinase [Hexamita inflata]|uniref:Kinase n=1 Tax=Hexamita inflata TaxID=28002 RepID=A0ABP1KRD4_9EUKA
MANQMTGETDESKTLNRLSDIPHFGLPLLSETFLHEEKQVIVQEFIKGPTLFEHINEAREQTERTPVVPEVAIKSIIKQLLFTVRFCHQHGVAHQDIKTDNIKLQNGTRVILLDFGEAYDVHLVEKQPNAANHIGNLVFLPPEILMHSSIISQSFLELDKMNFSAEAILKCQQLLINQRQPIRGNKSMSSAYIFKRLHHVQSMYELSNHGDITCLDLWIGGLKRIYEYGKIQTRRYSMTKAPEQQIMDAFKQQKVDLNQDNYPSQDDLSFVAIQLAMSHLKAQNLHTFNYRMAADAWSIGMTSLIMIFGDRPFKDLSQYEHVPAIQILADAIRVQLEETIDQLSGENEDFYEYRTASQNIRVQIPEGPFPQQTPIDLFLLMASLLHPHPKIRMSVSEALGCPFLQAQDNQEDETTDISNVQRGLGYEEIDKSRARLDTFRETNLDMEDVQEQSPLKEVNTDDNDFNGIEPEEIVDEDY